MSPHANRPAMPLAKRIERGRLDAASRLLNRCHIPDTVRATIVGVSSWNYLVSGNGTRWLGAPETMRTDQFAPWASLMAVADPAARRKRVDCWRTLAGNPVLTVEAGGAVLVFTWKGNAP